MLHSFSGFFNHQNYFLLCQTLAQERKTSCGRLSALFDDTIQRAGIMKQLADGVKHCVNDSVRDFLTRNPLFMRVN